jgi:hypothetical protein
VDTETFVVLGYHYSYSHSCLQVALRLTRLLTKSHNVTSIIRDPDHESDIKAASATPLLLSLEHASVEDFANAFEGSDVVYFSAGAAGKGGEERTKKVDYEGAIKVYDAIERVNGTKPRLILVSAVDIRDPEKIPEHYVRRQSLYSTHPFTDHSVRLKQTWKCPNGSAALSPHTCVTSTRQTRTSSTERRSNGLSSVLED